MRGSSSIPALSSPGERKRDIGNDLVGLRATGALGSADLESVLEAAVDISEVGHAAGTGRLASLGLLAPVDCCSDILVSRCSVPSSQMLDPQTSIAKHYEKDQRDMRTLASLSGGVTTVGAGRLLDVEGPGA